MDVFTTPFGGGGEIFGVIIRYIAHGRTKGAPGLGWREYSTVLVQYGIPRGAAITGTLISGIAHGPIIHSFER